MTTPRTTTAAAARILRGVVRLFEQPGTWTQDAWARDEAGKRLTRAHDDEAVCWCLIGAIRKVRGPGMSSAEDVASVALRKEICRLDDNGPTISMWNDDPTRTVDDVRRVLTMAAERLEAALARVED